VNFFVNIPPMGEGAAAGEADSLEMSFHIIDRKHRLFVPVLETFEEARQRLDEELLENPEADLFIFSAGDDPAEPGGTEPFLW
jgi:hypothetical protein